MLATHRPSHGIAAQLGKEGVRSETKEGKEVYKRLKKHYWHARLHCIAGREEVYNFTVLRED